MNYNLLLGSAIYISCFWFTHFTSSTFLWLLAILTLITYFFSCVPKSVFLPQDLESVAQPTNSFPVLSFEPFREISNIKYIFLPYINNKCREKEIFLTVKELAGPCTQLSLGKKDFREKDYFHHLQTTMAVCDKTRLIRNYRQTFRSKSQLSLMSTARSVSKVYFKRTAIFYMIKNGTLYINC